MRIDNLIIELGTEELPPKSLKKLAQAFCDGLQTELQNAKFEFNSINWFAAPRRLAVNVIGLSEQQPDQKIEKRGPAIAAAFDADGNPTKAAQGWARGCGIEVSQAKTLKTDKGEWLLFEAEEKGKTISDLLELFVNNALKALPIPKPMRWGNGSHEFIRPAHTLCAIYGEQVLAIQALGLLSSNKVSGHRFHSGKLLELNHADSYLATLESGYVLADYQQRQSSIQQQIENICQQLNAVTPNDPDLLDEVTSLVEWPVALVGTFDESFLAVPPEALIYTMKDDQKYFPLFDKSGALLNKFIFISNIESNDPSQVISGNEKVVRPRLADAEFFYNQDLKQSLASRLESLDTVLFQKQLGTLKDKSERISKLAGFIATQVSANSDLAARAGLLSKTDLMTNVVMEFTDTQGVMGKYYALHDGEDPIVADALYQQYMPRFAGDELPSSLEACSVALADKIDSIVGIFGISQFPKGDKDPFALRRATIGIIRIFIEKQLDVSIRAVLEYAQQLYGTSLTNDSVIADVESFILGRYQGYYADQGVGVELIRAVEVKAPDSALDFDKRLQAVLSFAQLPEAESLSAANKRVNNILAKNEATSFVAIQPSVLVEDSEIALNNQLNAVEPSVVSFFNDGNYQAGLLELAKLSDDINAFFDNVMVMADDEELRNNRLAILGRLQSLFMHTADISVL